VAMLKRWPPLMPGLIEKWALNYLAGRFASSAANLRRVAAAAGAAEHDGRCGAGARYCPAHRCSDRSLIS